VGGPPLPQSKYNMADGRHPENRYDVIFPMQMFPFERNSAGGCRMTRRLRQWSRWKPEAEFQYGRRLFLKTGSSYISAVDWDMSTKFGLLIYFAFLKAVTSTNTKPEVVFSGRGRHIEKQIWRHFSVTAAPIWTKFGLCKITCRLRPNGRDWNRK